VLVRLVRDVWRIPMFLSCGHSLKYGDVTVHGLSVATGIPVGTRPILGVEFLSRHNVHFDFYVEVGEGRRTAARLNRAASGYRLPTEAEWEYAAKAGTELTYAGSDSIDEVAWYKYNASYQTHPVARMKPNACGLYDMSGNVYEWCSDAYVPDAYRGRGELTVDPLVASSEYVDMWAPPSAMCSECAWRATPKGAARATRCPLTPPLGEAPDVAQVCLVRPFKRC
jgi:hypothetical protein